MGQYVYAIKDGKKRRFSLKTWLTIKKRKNQWGWEKCDPPIEAQLDANKPQEEGKVETSQLGESQKPVDENASTPTNDNGGFDDNSGDDAPRSTEFKQKDAELLDAKARGFETVAEVHNYFEGETRQFALAIKDAIIAEQNPE